MKIITILIISLIFSQLIFAQNNVIKINPIALTYGRYNLQDERMLTDYTSASISCSYIHPTIPKLGLITDALDEIGIGTSFGGAAIELDYRLYSKNKTGPRGFYIGPYFRYTGMGMSVKIDNLDFPLMDNSVDHLKDGFLASRTGLGIKLGAQWVLFKCITIDWNFFGLGADYYSLKVYSEGNVSQGGKTYSNQDVEKKGVFMPGFNTDFSIGYTF
jgi:hypothetical protein